MNIAELASYDGRDGRSAYIAVSGVVYDVSQSPHWQEGSMRATITPDRT